MSPRPQPALEGPASLEFLEAVTYGTDMLVLARGIGHELSNALQAVVLARSMNGPSLADADVSASLDKVTEQLTQAVTVLRELSRRAATEPRPTIVREVLEAVDRWQQYQKIMPRVPVQFDVTPNLPAVRADERRLRHALLALITNAKEAAHDARGTIVVSASATEGGVAIAVQDEGPGIAEELGERAFQPFVTTKTDRPHWGLGLTVARLAVEHSGGSLRIEPAGGPGARFVMRLPEWRRQRDT